MSRGSSNAAVDEDVPAREMRDELLDGAFDRSGGHHDPNDSSRSQSLNHVGEVVGALWRHWRHVV